MFSKYLTATFGHGPSNSAIVEPFITAWFIAPLSSNHKFNKDTSRHMRKGVTMKRCIMMLCLLLFLGLFAQVSITQAVSKTYTWEVSVSYSRYELFIATQDHWKTNTTVDVDVRLTLIYKHSSLDHAKTSWMQVVIKSSEFILDSGRKEEEVILTNERDYWEKTIPMQIPSSKLEQGENITMSIEIVISIDEFDNVQHERWNHVYSTSYDPIHADVTRPVPMFWETTIGILAIGLGTGIIVVMAIAGILLYRKSKKPISHETIPKE